MLKSVTIDFDLYIQELKNEYKKGHQAGVEEGGVILAKCLNLLRKLTEVKICAPDSQKEFIPHFKNKEEIHAEALKLSEEIIFISKK